VGNEEQQQVTLVVVSSILQLCRTSQAEILGNGVISADGHCIPPTTTTVAANGANGGLLEEVPCIVAGPVAIRGYIELLSGWVTRLLGIIVSKDLLSSVVFIRIGVGDPESVYLTIQADACQVL
jgi:hypothetical protein